MQSVEITKSAIINCNYELYFEVVNISNIQSKPRRESRIHMTIRIRSSAAFRRNMRLSSTLQMNRGDFSDAMIAASYYTSLFIDTCERI
jgi:hypothetical protein